MPLINFSGIASGIDTTALIKAATDASRRTQVTPKEDRVEELGAANTALEEYKTLVNRLRDTLLPFRTLEGGGVTKLAISSNESAILATASNAAPASTVTVNSIVSLARSHTFSFNQNFTSSSAPLNPLIDNNDPADPERTIKVEIGNPTPVETVEIEITNSLTVSEFIEEFNSQTDKARASLVTVNNSNPPQYRIVISSLQSGTTNGFLTVTNGSSVGTLSGFTESQASKAEFYLAGIATPINRDTNSVSDLIPGLTLELKGTTNTLTNITVDNDVTATEDRLRTFVEAFNDVVAFIKENNTVTRNEDGERVENIFAALSKTTTDDALLDSLRSTISSAESLTGTAVNILADIGITTNRDGTLAFDSEDFAVAMSTEASAVSEVLSSLADNFTATGGTIDLYTRFGGLLDVSININKDQVTELNSRIASAEGQIAKQEEALRARYARLEGIIGRMQGQQNAVSSALAQLGRGN